MTRGFGLFTSGAMLLGLAVGMSGQDAIGGGSYSGEYMTFTLPA
jgi:hypothetical protein